jgi:DNA polymerase-4
MPLRSLIVDFNSYFASVEQQERPELRGKPVAVAPLAAETTFVIAASYPAKAFGVKTGVRVAEARRLCPGLMVVEARPELYVRYHHLCLAAIETALPLGKVLSIDEVVCDLPPEFTDPGRAADLARKIKAALRARVGECMTCSIGIGPNSLLAKVASDMRKPDGLVVLHDGELPHRLFELSLRDFSGIGPRMEERLKARGIGTVRALYEAPVDTARALWGSVEGERFWRRLHGEDIPWAETNRSTVSHEHVLPPDMRHPEPAFAVLQRLLHKGAMRLRAMGYFAGSLAVSVRYADRSKWSDELRFNDTNDTFELVSSLRTLWKRRPPTPQAPRKVGICLSRLLPGHAHTGDLFDTTSRRAPLLRAVDTLNASMGKNTVFFGGAHGALNRAPTRIAFNHIPDATEMGELDDTITDDAPDEDDV